MAEERVLEVNARRLLKKEKIPGLFGGRYRFSPYMACGHRCIYCDGRFEKYHVEGDFDRDITARINAPELLENEVVALREPGPICISSGISDPYQPVEESLGITRRCAEVLSRYRMPVVIHTKSALAMRDLDLWEKVHKKSGFTLMVSLTMVDDSIREGIEPGASTVDDRLEMIRAFRERGMNAGVLAMPFIPFLTDSTENMDLLLKRTVAAGGQFALPGLLTLKQGRQKDFFFSILRRCMPDLVNPLRKLYSNNNRWGNPPRSVCNRFYRDVQRVWFENQADDLIPHIIYRNMFSLYDQFTILLRDMTTLYRRNGINTDRLCVASDKLGKWIAEKRRFCGRRRNLSYSVIDDYLRTLLHSGELEGIMDNRKLTSFLQEVEKGSVFNHRTLKLERCGG